MKKTALFLLIMLLAFCNAGIAQRKGKHKKKYSDVGVDLGDTQRIGRLLEIDSAQNASLMSLSDSEGQDWSTYGSRIKKRTGLYKQEYKGSHNHTGILVEIFRSYPRAWEV